MAIVLYALEQNHLYRLLRLLWNADVMYEYRGLEFFCFKNAIDVFLRSE